MTVSVGDRVSWKWGEGEGDGEVVARSTRKVTRRLQGTEVTRNATEDEPAFLIRQEDGAEVLKSASELNPG